MSRRREDRDRASRRVLALGEPDSRGTAWGIAFGLFTAGSAIGLLAVSGYLIAAAALQPPILYLQMAIVGVRAFALGRAFFRYCERLITHDATFRTLGRLRSAVFAALIPGAPANLVRAGRGDTVARLVADIDEMQNLPLRVWQPLITTAVAGALSVLGVALVSWPAALVLAACLVIAAALGGLLPARVSDRAASQQAATRGRQFDETLEFVEAQQVLTAFDANSGVLARIAEHDAERFSAERKTAWATGVSGAIVSAASGAAVLGSLLVAAPALTAGQLGGALLTMIVLVPMSVFEVFAMAPLALSAAQKVRASAERIDELVPEAKPWSQVVRDQSPDDDESPRHPPELHELELVDAAVAWPGEAPAVSDVSFRLTPGRRLLVTGASGSGKTSLAWGLVGFLPLQAGSYRVNGLDATNLGATELRRIVGLCEQSPHVFNSSVRANLLVAAPGADDDELREVLEHVGLWHDLAARSGLDTAVGVHGGRLSGGQVQRLALARALLARFPVIVLDEPTANVDPELAQTLMRDLLVATTSRQYRPAVVLMSHDAVPPTLVDEHLRLPSRRA